jgi:hypothetical protein
MVLESCKVVPEAQGSFVLHIEGSIPLNRCKECFTRIKSKQLVSVAAVPFASASSFVEWTRNEDAAGYIALHLTVYLSECLSEISIYSVFRIPEGVM